MAKYLLLYHGGTQPSSPEEGAEVMKAWTDWFGTLGTAILDGGDPTGPTRTISGGTVSDDPNGATGYSLISAESLDAAVELAMGCPHLSGGGTVSVAEALPVM